MVEWTESAGRGFWTAYGPSGTRWDIIERGGRCGVIIGQWDHPDWWADSLEQARAIADEREGAPPIPPSQWTIERPHD